MHAKHQNDIYIYISVSVQKIETYCTDTNCVIHFVNYCRRDSGVTTNLLLIAPITNISIAWFDGADPEDSSVEFTFSEDESVATSICRKDASNPDLI